MNSEPETVRVTVLRAFPYSDDGMRVRTLEPGPAEVRSGLLPGLEAEGLVERLSSGPNPAATPDAVIIPENWASLPWAELKVLAIALKPDWGRSKEDALETVQAELARRQAAA